jgi:hypothetical protein
MRNLSKIKLLYLIELYSNVIESIMKDERLFFIKSVYLIKIKQDKSTNYKYHVNEQ